MTTTNTTAPENFFQKIEDFFINLFKKEVPVIEQSIAKFADAVTNNLKTVVDSDGFNKVLNGLEAAAETVDPALTPMIQGLNLEIPKILNLVTGVTAAIDAEVQKPIEEQALDALKKLKIIKADTSTGQAVYAGAQGTISAAVQHYITSNNSILATPAQLITSGQAAHATA